VADVHHRVKNGTYHVRFRLHGEQYERSLQTRARREADDLTAVIRQTVLAIERGHLEVPAGLDPVAFVVSGGRLRATPKEEPAPDKPLPAVPTLAEAGERYLATYPPGSKETETLATERHHVNHLKRVLGADRPLTSLQLGDLQRYVTQRAREPGRRGTVQRKTIKMELDTFRQIWNWAADEALVEGTCPTSKRRDGRNTLAVKLPRARQKEPFKSLQEVEATLASGVSPKREAELWECVFLTGGEIAELLAHVREKARHPWVYPAFCFAAYTGARISEVCRTRVEDVDFASAQILLREKKKSKEKDTLRKVPMAEPLAEALREWLAVHPGGEQLFLKPRNAQRPGKDHVPLRRPAAENHFKLTLKNSKWAKLHGWHLFRHSFASNLARSGQVDPSKIDELMGHQTEEMRKRYRHLFPEDMKNAMAVLTEMYAPAAKERRSDKR
jgi:integrase